MRWVALLAVAAASVSLVGADGCFLYDTDLLGNDVNYGLANRKESAAECQDSCQTEPTCNYWVWVSTEFETDPDYWYACWYKDKVDQVLARTGVVAGPKICPEGAEGCCTTLTLDSWGGASFDQEERLGTYAKYLEMADGRFTYQQEGGDQYLYYMEDSGIWMVGPEIGVDYGGILNRNTGQCPEDLTTPWEYWTWYEEWSEDDQLEATCSDGSGGDGGDGGDDHDYEECTSGPACLDCSITASENGVMYCCEEGCDYGGIETWQENGDVGCRCWHD